MQCAEQSHLRSAARVGFHLSREESEVRKTRNLAKDLVSKLNTKASALKIF